MARPRNVQSPDLQVYAGGARINAYTLRRDPVRGVTRAYIPKNLESAIGQLTVGFAPGCILHGKAGGGSGVAYVNTGTTAAANWGAVQ